MKTMGAETAEDSTGLLFDSDGIDCDFSISLVDILAILDEEPQSQLPDPSVSQGSADGFQHGDHFDLEKPFRSQAESTMNQVNFRVIGHSQSNLENASASKRETGLDFLPQSQGNFSDIPDRGAHVSLHSSHDQSNWLRLSYANNYAMNEHGGSSLFSQNFAELHVPNDIVKDAGLIYPPAANVNDLYVANVNDLYVNGELERNEIQEHGTFFSTACRESQVNVKNVCSSSKLQNGETGTSHGLPIEIFFPSGGVQSCMSSVALPESTVEDGNLYSSLSCIDPDASAPDIFNPDVNNFEATNIICDGSNSFFPRVSCMNAEFYLDQTGSDRFSPLHSTINEKFVKTEDHLLPSRNSYWRGDLKLSKKEESPDSTLPDVLTDMGLSSTEELYSEYNDSDDLSLISESSTDSSPVPFSRNSLSTQIDGSVLRGSNSLLSGPDATWPNKPRPFMKDEMGDQMLQSHHKHQGDQLLRSCPKQHSVPKDGSGAVQNNLSRSTISLEDTDICILDDISDPVCPRGPLARLKQHPIAQRSGLNSPHYRAIGGMGLGANDERVTLRMALEDLSQPMSEASPPDGVLAVPLLRHQQIALSWMVQKETNLNCAGGILADDQGLGKTVSTIALILTERSPSSQHLTVSKKENEFEALNLDDDDDDAEISVKQPRSCISMIMRKSVHKKDPGTVLKGRPAAGTLVVCPTSVLRQWADELQSKVTSIANLSFLVYHGSNRTKDPNELAKYDVVLTTYAIVSMEVPKQPLVDKDDEEKGKKDASGASNALLNSKKRKTPTSDSKCQKGIGTTDGTLLESTARPLGRVGWFRVVLDEAQSIKNHRTQVARACWGLRAKRRWCLSGTPIQNAIDDLYSYFRFLRFDPYAAYQKFCSTIKIPISRNPTKGYKKLQTVLKTIMLRRTKGTLLDGKPIVSLPLKTISLEKVDFSVEERQFYSALEAESREQFMEYEDAGTVKQNYVNILLMLLRLRQACDHPLLVKDCDSNSSLRSSMEKVKKLPRDKKIILLSCLEVSLAICTICNDPPEDAVVTICGHVFCNQCICEHLTAEENICPSPNCKERLSAASVFSRRTLQCSLSDHLGDGCSSGNSDFESGDKHKNRGMNWSSYSSKIKAAVEILRSLPKSQCCSKSNVKIFGVESFNSSVNPSNAVSESSSIDSSSVKQTSYVSEKAIVFSQWTRMLDLLEIPLQESCIHYRRLDGTMSVAARDKAIKDFNTLPEVTVIIMSLKAASLGLNLVAANHVLLLDLWWNPTTEDQAIDRAHRIGQTRPVTVSRLTVKDTVEDKILRLQEKKRVMVASAFGEDDSGSRQTRLTVEDLRYLFT